MEVKITESNFEEEVIKSSLPVLVDFYADWCGPCKMMAPLVEELAKNYEGTCKVGKCNVDENGKLAQQYKVMSIPTFLFFKNGEAVETIIGAVSKSELENKMKQVTA